MYTDEGVVTNGEGETGSCPNSYLGLVEDMTKREGQASELAADAGRIFSITGMITELANQSSLLAMNASIEAACRRAWAWISSGCGRGTIASKTNAQAVRGYIAPLEQIQRLAADTAKGLYRR